MTKLAIIPFTVLLQTLFYSKSFSLPTKLALVILLMVCSRHAKPRPVVCHSLLFSFPPSHSQLSSARFPDTFLPALSARASEWRR